MTFVKGYERKAPSKSPEYISTHMALMTSEEQRLAFARRHGVVLVEHLDQPEHSERKSIIDRFMPWFGGRRV